jgi:hypothetical protein
MYRKTLLLMAVMGMISGLASVCIPLPAYGKDDIPQTGTATPVIDDKMQGTAARSDTPVLYVYREGLEYGYHVASVQIDNGLEFNLEAGTYVMWPLTPGLHRIETSDSVYSLEAEAGGAYYLCLDADHNLFGRWRHPLIAVNTEKGQQAVARTQQLAVKKEYETPPQTPLPPINTAGKFRIEPSIFLGGGTSNAVLISTTAGQVVEISGGGGTGLGITLGYGLSPSFDIEAAVGNQVSRITAKGVQDISGSFDRNFFLVTLKYKYPVHDRAQLKFGIGAGYYQPGKLQIDTTRFPGGSRDVVYYDNAIGYHATAEGEIFVRPNISFTLGGKYYHVIYNETYGTRNGVPGFFTDGNVRNFDGGGFDFCFSAALYL